MTAVDQETAIFTRIAPSDAVLEFDFIADAEVVEQSSTWIYTVLLRLLGGSMVLASTGIWLVADAGEDPERALLRLGVSVVTLSLGLVLLLRKDSNASRQF